jgi:biotin carboxyl carrier protein
MISSSFNVRVNEQADFTLENKNADQFDCVPLEGRKYHILSNGTSYEAELIGEDFGERSYSIQIGSNVYQVKIQTDLDRMIRSMGYKLSSENAANDVRAPMPGIILEMKAQPGNKVKKGDTLLILEAMKMENAILSPKDGIIKSVWSDKGDTVDKNKLLIELE